MKSFTWLCPRVLQIAVPAFFLALPLAAQGGDSTRLLKELESPDVAVRQKAAESLAENARFDLATALPALTDALADENAEVRFFAAVALSKAAYSDEQNATELQRGAGPLAKHLADPDARVRESLALAFALMRPAVPMSAIPALLGRLNDQVPRVNAYAVDALAKVRPVAPSVVDAVLGELKYDQSSTVRGTAARALGTMGDTRREVIEALTTALRDPAPFVRQEAVRTLGRIGPPAASALEELERLAKDPGSDEVLRQIVKAAILRIKGKL